MILVSNRKVDMGTVDVQVPFGYEWGEIRGRGEPDLKES